MCFSTKIDAESRQGSGRQVQHDKSLLFTQTPFLRNILTGFSKDPLDKTTAFNYKSYFDIIPSDFNHCFPSTDLKTFLSNMLLILLEMFQNNEYSRDDMLLWNEFFPNYDLINVYLNLCNVHNSVCLKIYFKVYKYKTSFAERQGFSRRDDFVRTPEGLVA